MNPTSNYYDIIVIGGGPAGLMAAGRAAELGARVILLEKNPNLGRKLLLTGGGRCNLMNYEPDIRRFLDRFKENKKFLFSPFSQFGIPETLAFFNNNGLATKLEAEGRVFPASNSSQSVLDVMINYIKINKVHLKTSATVIDFIKQDQKIKGLRLNVNGVKKDLFAKNFIIATGGSSRPETGSTGDGFNWLKLIGHQIPDTAPALVPIKTQEAWVKQLSGLSLTDVKLKVITNNKKVALATGKLLFTHFGLSGPLILNLSHLVGKLLKNSTVVLTLDLRPETDHFSLDRELQEYLAKRQNRLIKNCLAGFVPSALAPILINLAALDGKKPVNLLRKIERTRLVNLLKNLEMTATGLMGLDKAIITRGGVNLKEINLKTMQSRMQSNIYITGDLLDIDRPSGGYSLQLCWTTGYVAGSWAVKNLK